MSESWDDYAAEWNDNRDAILYSIKAFNSLTETINPKGLNILDFGCGTGLLTEKISPIADNIVALDSSKKMIGVLQSKNLPNITTVIDTLTENTINVNTALHNKFDLIVASSVLGFIPDYESTLSLLKSLLASDGILIQWDWLSSADNSDFGLSIEKTKSAHLRAGFNLTSVTTPFSLANSTGTQTVLMAVSMNT